MAKTVRVKSKCCKDDPRCKRCPVVWKKLANADRAERIAKRDYVPANVTKKSLAAARAR